MTIKKAIPIMLLLLFIGCGTAVAEEGDIISINSATAEQLVAVVPGMSMSMAQAIVAYREDMGDVQDMNELLEIKGMTKELLEQVKKTVGLEALSGAECSC